MAMSSNSALEICEGGEASGPEQADKAGYGGPARRNDHLCEIAEAA